MDNQEQLSVSRKHLLIAIALSLGLSLPAILSSYVIDDRVFTNDSYNPGTFSMYNYVSEMKRLDFVPWWTSEDLEIRFMRPLSSALLNLDFAIGNKHPIVPHLHQALWFIALLVGAYRVLQQLLSDRRQMVTAMYLFAIASFHTFLVGFIATRHAIMANTFGVWALYHYISSNKQNGKRHHVIALVLFALGLLSGETAMAFAPLAIAYDLFYVNGTIKEKLQRSVWVIGVSMGYLLLYRLLGYGTNGTAFYTDPFSSPLVYLQSLPSKIMAMLGDFALGIPSHMMLDEDAYKLPVFAGILALVIVGGLVVSLWKRLNDQERKMIKFASVASLVAMLPGLAGQSAGRAFTLSGLLFTILAAVILVKSFADKASLLKTVVVRTVAVLLCIGMVGLAGFFRIAQSELYIRWGGILNDRLAAQSLLPCTEGANVYLINGEIMSAYYIPFVAAKSDPTTFNHWYELVSTRGDITVRREAADRLAITHKKESLISPMSFDLFTDSRIALQKGEVIKRDGLEVAVKERSQRGPVDLEFTIPNLDNPSETCLLTLENYTFKPFQPPKPGEITVVSYVQPMI